MSIPQTPGSAAKPMMDLAQWTIADAIQRIPIGAWWWLAGTLAAVFAAGFALAHWIQSRKLENTESELALDACEEILQRGVVRRIPGEHLIGQRKTLRRDDQCNHHLHAVGPVITRVAELALALILQRRVDLKVGRCEVVQEHIEADVE